MGVCEFHHEFCVHDIRPRAKHLAVQLHHFCQHEQGHSINVRAHLPKPHLVMHSGVCEATVVPTLLLVLSTMSTRFIDNQHNEFNDQLVRAYLYDLSNL